MFCSLIVSPVQNDICYKAAKAKYRFRTVYAKMLILALWKDDEKNNEMTVGYTKMYQNKGKEIKQTKQHNNNVSTVQI